MTVVPGSSLKGKLRYSEYGVLGAFCIVYVVFELLHPCSDVVATENEMSFILKLFSNQSFSHDFVMILSELTRVGPVTVRSSMKCDLLNERFFSFYAKTS